jgi:hypothetical protein
MIFIFIVLCHCEERSNLITLFIVFFVFSRDGSEKPFEKTKFMKKLVTNSAIGSKSFSA